MASLFSPKLQLKRAQTDRGQNRYTLLVAQKRDALYIDLVKTLFARLRVARRSSALLLTGALSSVLLLGAAVTAMGGFTATITNTGNSFASGSLVLQEGQSTTTCLSTANPTAIVTNSNNCTTINLFGATNAEPGGTATTTSDTFTNVGTLGGSTFTVVVPSGSSCTVSHNTGTTSLPNSYFGSDTSGYCGKVDITIEDTTTSTCVYPAGAAGAGCPALSNTYTLATLAGATTPVSLGSLPAGGTASFTITTQLDSSATNADQGLAASVPLTWELAQ